MTRSTWSGGVKWGPVTSGVVGKWMPDGATPSGRPVPDIAIAGAAVTNKVQSGQWSLGPSDYLADLATGTASITFVGLVSAAPDDDLVISTAAGTMFVGRVETVSDRKDLSGNHWTTVTATDRVGQLGRTQLRKSNGLVGDLVEIATKMAKRAGITLDVEDASVGTYGLPTLQWWKRWLPNGFTGSLLDYINIAARSSNAMIALQPGGSLKVMTRETLPGAPSTVTLSGNNAPTTWTKTLAWGNDVNVWSFTDPDGTESFPNTRNGADVIAHGERAFTVDNFLDTDTGSGVALAFLDWWAYTPAARAVVTNGEFVVKDLGQTELLTLAPLDWVTVDGDDWQVMSMQWSVEAPGEPMRLAITADDFLVRLSGATIDCGLSLQAKIDAASAGDTLDLSGCVYTDAATINKALTLKGLTLNYTGAGPGISVTANDVTIQDCTLNGQGFTTFYLNNAAIRVPGTSGAGRITGLVVRNNTITGWSYGVDAFYTTDQDIRNNTIKNIAYAGVELHSALRGYVQENAISDVGVVDAYYFLSPSGQYNSYGVTCTRDSGGDDRSTDVIVQNNVIDNVPNWHGLDTHAGDGIQWLNNKVTRTNRGLFITGDGFGGISTDNVVNDNDFSNPTPLPGTGYGYNERAITIIAGTTGTTGTGNTADGYPFGEGISGNTGTNTISDPTETHGY